MSKKFSNFKRFMTMFLIVVMLVGMLPMTASATDTGGSTAESGSGNRGDDPPSGSGGRDEHNYDHDEGRFTRYTLVRFEFSDNTEATIPARDWADKGKVVGSIDVLTDGSVPAGTKYFKTDSGLLSNAFSYRKGDEGVKLVDGYSVDGQKCVNLFGNLPAYPTSHKYQTLRYTSSDGDPLMCALGGALPDGTSNVPMWAANSTFNEILRLIVASSSNTEARAELESTKYYNPANFKIANSYGDIVPASTLSASEAENFKYSYNFIASAVNNETCYRLLAEPGVITNIPVGMDGVRGSDEAAKAVPAAVTLRDIASVLLTEENAITKGNSYFGRSNKEYEGEMAYVGIHVIPTEHKYSWLGNGAILNYDKNPGIHAFWFIVKNFFTLQRHAYGLYNKNNAFRTYVFSQDNEGNITNVVFNTTPDSEAFFRSVSPDIVKECFGTGGWNWNDSKRYKYSCYSIAQYILNIYKHGDGMLGWGEGRGTGLAGSNIPVYKEGAYPAMGLGIIEPGSMITTIIPAEDTITIKKIIGNGLDKSEKWEFKLSVPALNYGNVCNADLGVSIVNEDDSSVSFTEEDGNMVYSFELGNEESRTFKINIPNSDFADYVKEQLVWTIEEVAAKGLLDANEGIEDENERFSVLINDVKDDDGIIDGVQLGTTTVFKNQKDTPPPEGNLHLIVDYNIPGAAATTAPNKLSGNIVDCGGAAPGECLDVDLEVNGQKLIPGSGGGTGTVIEPTTGVKFKFVGLSTKPDGISYNGVDNNGVLSHKGENTYTYQMPTKKGDGSDVDDNLLVLYVIWELEVDKETIIIKDDDDPVPGGGKWYTVYWVLNYDGGGITSQTCGQITIPAFTIGCGHCGMSGQRPAFTLSYGFDPPYIHSSLSSYREGHYFAGWIVSDPKDTIHSWENFQGSCPVVEGFEMNAAVSAIDYSKTNIYASKPSTVPQGFQWITGPGPDSPITVNPADPGESRTYYAVWVAEKYFFYANGGHFLNMPANYQGVTSGAEKLQSDEAYGPLIESVTDTHITYKRHHIGVGWRVYAIPQCEPVREGYTFTGWYYDKACTVPLDLTEEGVKPMRTYYAGWEADPVYVTYYDTREGTTEVATQVYSYDDYLDRLAPMESTVGWTFSDWVKNGTSVKDETLLNASILTCHDTLYGDHAPVVGLVDDALPDSIGNQGAGVMSHRHFWTLDLTAAWNQKYASYNVLINFNDYKNNDGARPTAMTLGIVDSITNREVTTLDVELDSSELEPGIAADQITRSTDAILPITVNDSSTERVKYYAYLKDYTDIDGNTYTIQNVEASSGEIELASRSNADTSPVASYRYTLNRVNTGNVTDKPNTNGAPEYTGVLYFDHNLMTTGDDIEFTIRWNDQSDNDGMRPETLKLTLMGRTKGGTWVPVQDWVSTSNGQLHQSNSGVVYVNSGICDVSDDGNVWTYIFKDFQKYENGEYIEYAIKVDGYEEYSYKASVTGYVEDGVTLTYEPVKAPVPIDIHWHDNANQDGMRPSSVVVDLVAHQWNRDLGAYESVVVRSKLFTGFGATSNVWSSSFDNMPVYHGGEPIIYHLVVTSDLNGNMDGDSNPYTWSEGIVGNPYKDGARSSVDIYHNADERSVTATVQWDDNGNQDGKRPDSVTLQLYANNEPVPGDEYTVVLTGDPKALTWNYTFDHLDVYTEGRSGKEIVYKVKILDAQGGEFESYAPSYINKNGQFVETFGASGEAFVLMSYKPKTGTVSGAVYWQDDGNRDGERPDFVTVALHASAFDNSTGEWIDFVAATKTVRSDGDNTMTADQWRFEFENMPVYRGSQPITYYITITSDLNGNTNDTALLYGWGEKDRGDMASDPELEVSVTVYQGVETISVTATVEWDDDNNNDGLRPNAVQLQLYADNVRVAGEAYTVTLYGNPTDDVWTHTFEHLPRYASGASGKEINYTIAAIELKDGDIYGRYEEIGRDGTEHSFIKYQDYYVTDAAGGLSTRSWDSLDSYVKLVHKNNEIEVPFSIVWKDQNNRDAQRPDYVTVALMAYQWNGTLHTWEATEKATATVPSDEINTMTADEWSGTFGEQEMYHGGIKVIYHLSVTSDLNAYIPEGSFEYGWIESAYGNQLDAVPQVTVSQNINTVTVPATVYWDDNGNNDGIRPANIVLQLYAHEPGGTPVPVAGQAYRVNLTGDPKAGNWNYTFSGMPKYAEGRSGVELIYTVQVIEAEGEPLYGYYIITANGEEEEVLRYEASYLYEDTETGTTENTLDPDMSDRAYVRLSHISETQTMVFSANWHDSDDVDGVRPVNVSADLYKTVGDGEQV